jgi:hypothetical protein
MTRGQESFQLATGAYGKYQLMIMSQKQRVDLTFGPLPRMGPIQLPLSLGDLTTIHADFSALIERWLVPQSDIQRLGMGAVIWRSASDQQAALNILVPLMHTYTPGAGRVADFALQINRPRTSTTIPGLEINRVAIWQAATVQVLNVTLVGEAPPPSPPFHRAQLTLDINTADGGPPIPTAQVTNLSKEMVAFLEEIPRLGDVS